MTEPAAFKGKQEVSRSDIYRGPQNVDISPPILDCVESVTRGEPVFRGNVPAAGGGLVFEVYDRITQIGPALWQKCFPEHWKNYSYYQTLEETFAEEFPQRYLVLRVPGQDGEVRAVQPLFFVKQDLTAGLGAKIRAALAPIRRFLAMRLMMVGCIVGDGQIGVASLEEVPGVLPALDAALSQYAAHEGVSLVLFKEFPTCYRVGLAELARSGRYARFPSLPAVGLDLDFASFEEYLQTRLGKATRKSIRRKFKETGELTAAAPVVLEVKESITPEEATVLHALYERVALRGDVHFEVFTKEYFLRLAERLPDRARFFVWRQGARVVAFSFCIVHGDAIYDNDFGADEELAYALNLYHVTFRDIIDWALAHGIRRYYSSPFNYAPKLHLRMHLVPLDLYARHTSRFINFFLRRIAPLLAPTKREPLLAQFANAAELLS